MVIPIERYFLFIVCLSIFITGCIIDGPQIIEDAGDTYKKRANIDVDLDSDSDRDTDSGTDTGVNTDIDTKSDAVGDSDTGINSKVDTKTDAGSVSETVVCVPDEVRRCLGALGNCTDGTQRCAADGSGWGECSILPQKNDSCVAGDDANCNGTPNENCKCEEGATQPCGPNKEQGICVFGRSVCKDQTWSKCDGEILPADRNCESSLDNDCNGTVDNEETTFCRCDPNGAPRTCDPYERFGAGICTLGTQSCILSEDGHFTGWETACDDAVAPQEEVCDNDGLDEDCDGLSNEECECTDGETRRCGIETGVCRSGTQECADGRWLAECDGDIGPQERDCTSSEDNDCDGSPDNTIDGICQCTPGRTQSCETGACKVGTQTCLTGSNRATSYWGNCSGMVGPCSGSTPVCLNETCVECMPYDQRCANDGTTPQRCSSTGEWQNEDECSGDTPICDDDTGECICLEGSMNCLNEATERECISGIWVNRSCGGTTPVCYDAYCTQCAPPDRVCADNSTFNICRENGTWESETCEVLCIDDECVDPADESGMVMCDPSEALVCYAPQFCCYESPYEEATETGECVSSVDDCDFLDTKIYCDGPNDCTGEVCCLQQDAAKTSTVCIPQSECIDSVGGAVITRQTVCDPDSPICPYGESCQAAWMGDRWEGDIYSCRSD